jgi:hypothetical protein
VYGDTSGPVRFVVQVEYWTMQKPSRGVLFRISLTTADLLKALDQSTCVLQGDGNLQASFDDAYN